MSKLSRRGFLKALGLSGTAAITACSPESARKLIPYIIPPEDIVPGEATWYTTTCRECPAGCGVLAKNRDGHIIKVEGNPLHPVNQGKLCARGQASVQGLYNPDRIKGPLKRNSQGKWEGVSWEDGENLLIEKVSQIVQKGRGERVVFLTDLISGTLKDLIVLWLSQMGSRSHLQYEPFSYESFRKANEIIWGIDGIPTYRLEQSDFLISFGADFLEAWLSDVQYAREFSNFRSPQDGHKSSFIYVGPRLSLTAANADRWVSVPPGGEFLIALGMMKIIVDENIVSLSSDLRSSLQQAFSDWSLSQIQERTGVKEETLRDLAMRFGRAKRPLALAGGGAMENAIAANLLCALVPGTQDLVDFESLSGLGELASTAEMKGLTGKMGNGEIEVLMIYNTNPAFSLPAAWNFEKAMRAVPFIVTFSSTLDETSQHAHLCLPTHSPLEAWGDYSPRKGVYGLMQPVMGALFDTRHLGDILLSSGRRLRDPSMFPWQGFYQMLRYTWELRGRRQSPGAPRESFWQEALQRGGSWIPEGQEVKKIPSWPVHFSFPSPEAIPETPEGFKFVAYPTVELFDGRGANRPWLQELPDPLTQITWESWIEIHPETARKAGIVKGDLLQIQTPQGTLEGRAFLYPGIHPGTLGMPIGRGHTAYGRFAANQPGNPFQILSSQPDAVSGGNAWFLSGVRIKNLKNAEGVPHTDGSWSQHDRELARSVTFAHYQTARGTGQRPSLRLPIPEGYTRKDDIYKAHPHPDYRWIMVVDLDRCIGCGACVIACYAENNVPFVGKEQVLRGREMAWLRIERYFEKEEPWVRFLPMLCQHCDDAPCESVCPMFAPNHSIDGLNNQVYNRCIGTFFCSQNCPYKVRRFNWFTFPRIEPLNLLLNPDVTVRHKGVMEKCSFCIQRIVEVKNRAKIEGRKVRDGEVIPACVQTCPTEALVFGNLRDPESHVSRLIQDPRAYQALDHLNTKPGVIYLKKLTIKMETT